MTENNPPPTAAAAEAAVAAAAEGEQPAPPNQLQTVINALIQAFIFYWLYQILFSSTAHLSALLNHYRPLYHPTWSIAHRFSIGRSTSRFRRKSSSIASNISTLEFWNSHGIFHCLKFVE